MDQRVRFGGTFSFDVATGQLWSGDREVRLTPKAAAVLKELMAHAGRPVSKDNLFATVWNGVAVSDDALTTCVQELRRALNDDPKQPRFIETRHRRGYGFVASLTPAPGQDTAAVPAPTPPSPSIAVLPFRRHEPGARSSASLRGHRGGADDGAVAGRGLARGGANGIVSLPADGRRRAGNRAAPSFHDAARRQRAEADGRLRITVQLVDVVSGYQHWSERFDRTAADVFAMQDEIAEHVATRVRGGLLTQRGAAAAGPTADERRCVRVLPARPASPRST